MCGCCRGSLEKCTATSFPSKCTGTFWAVGILKKRTNFAGMCGCRSGSLEKCTATFFPSKCTGSFWAVSAGLWLTCLTFDPKCTGTFWAVSMGCLTFKPKCTGTFWAVSAGLWLTCLTFDPKCSGTFWAVLTFECYPTITTCLCVCCMTLLYCFRLTRILLSLYRPILGFCPPFASSELSNFGAFYLTNLPG
jgi:hypothetical protein